MGCSGARTRSSCSISSSRAGTVQAHELFLHSAGRGALSGIQVHAAVHHCLQPQTAKSVLQSVTDPVSQSASQPACQPADRLVSRLCGQSVGRWITRLMVAAHYFRT